MAYTEMDLIAETSRGHVNNVQLSGYLDEARMEWYAFCLNNGAEAVLVHSGMDFKKEVFTKNKLTIRTSLVRVGNTSFALSQSIVNHLDELVVAAEVILATINSQTRTKVRVPENVRNLLGIDESLSHLNNTKHC